MKKLTFFIVLSMLFTCILIAQQDFWEQTSGPPGIWSGNNPNAAMNSSGHIFCASFRYVYRSTDHGLSWKELKNGLDIAQYMCIAINKQGHIFTGAWSYGGVFRSTDNGESWTKTSFTYGYPVKMAIDSLGNILVATFHDGAGIIRSTDEGETWSAIGPVTGAEMNSLAVNSKGYIFAGTGYGDWKVYRSTDNGSSWLFTGLNFSTQDFAFNSVGYVFVVRAYSYGSPSLYMSTNDGESWDTIKSCPPVPDGGTYTCVACDSADNVFIGYGSEPFGRAYRSTDGGTTWTQISDLECSDLLFDQYGHLILWGNGSGIMHSTDNGDHWQYTGPVNTRVYSLSSASPGILFTGLDAGIFYSSNNGNTWITAGLNTNSVQCILAVNSGSILVGTNNGIYSTTDYGVNWTASGLPNTSILCMERALGGDIFAGTAGSGLYRSTDDGISWSYVGLMNTNIKSFLPDVSGSILVGTENSGIYRSTDSGISWSFAGFPNTTVTSMAGSSVNILAGTNNGVYNSSDNGTSWAYAGLNGRNIQDLLIAATGEIYVATGDSGVYRSTNVGQTWTTLTSGLKHLNVTSLAIDHDGYLYAGTDGGGVYKSTSMVVGVRDEVVSLPTKYQLFQNYPNPFNPTTNFGFRIANCGFVTLKVYDVLGRDVATLVNGVKQPGHYTVQWDASSVPSGVYFYRLTAGTFTEVHKMCVIR